MILKGNQRGGDRQLAAHLLNTADNEHVHVYETRGFLSEDLPSAFHEAYAVSRGTRAKQFLFSLSLNPPRDEKVSTETFAEATNRVEKKLGLHDQPRAIVFHEKDGRRHAHAVWSRIDAAEMKAINLPHYKLKLRDVSRELFFEHGWQMPRGLVDSRERDPATFSHAEWQQAKRGGHDPKALKSMFLECWAVSDSGSSFAQALKARGYMLARGDRRGHVAVDYRGEVYAIGKWVDRKAKEVREKLGEPDQLPTVEQAKCEVVDRMTGMLKQHVADVKARQRSQAAALALRRADLIQRQREERAQLDRAHAERWARETRETRERAQRRATGLRGLCDLMTGRKAGIERENERNALHALRRDQAEKDQLIFAHIDEREVVHRHSRQIRRLQAEQVAELHRDIATLSGRAIGPRGGLQRSGDRSERLRPRSQVNQPGEHGHSR